MYQRFISVRRDIPHEVLQKFVAVDYFQKMVLVAVKEEDGKEQICGLGQYAMNSDMYTAEIALVVRDECQNQGVGEELLSSSDLSCQEARAAGIHSRGSGRK